MTTDLDSIKATLAGITRGDSVLDTLLEFERTLSNAEVFAYRHWDLGELVEGPDIGRYWFKTVWMYPFSKMPDPDGGLRLTKLGAKVSFKEGIFKRPVKVTGPEDWVDRQSKKAKMAEYKVWLVTIELPLKYIQRGLSQTDDIIMQDLQRTNQEIADAYDDAATNEALGQAEMPEDMGTDTGEEI